MSGSGRCGHFSAGALSRAWLRVHGAGRGRAALLSDAEKMLFDVLSERVAAATDGDPAAAFASSCGRVRKSALYCPRGITTTRPMPASPTGKRSRRAQIRYLPMRWTRPRSGPLPPPTSSPTRSWPRLRNKPTPWPGPTGCHYILKSPRSACARDDR
jgi:hypothetical protein